ncbi:xanthine dehydrogenase family protein molybdopterin-binding subunit [Actinocrispum sp. NPDC049592]|uniref:xanthine dehydrogenase family protein molybdopterin-binding subunit n=1 Tax=Actinocrispum sp. NPDC049592 TaxID=3154835 RepID=UPI00343EC373
MNVRVDARDKVTGAVHYGDDRVPPGLLYARFAVATIGRGRVVSIDTEAAEAVEGVRLVLTHESGLGLKNSGFLMSGQGFGFQSLQPLASDHIAYRGQYIAMVVAETPHAAVHGASLIHATYEEEPFSVELDADGVEVFEQSNFIPNHVAGDADATLEGCEFVAEGVYDHPAQHAVPMELHNTTVMWDADTLIVHESTQNASSIQAGLAAQLGISAEQVQVISPSAGGGFGNRNSLQMHTSLAAIAAQRLGRPVKALVTRPQAFHNGSFRPATRQHIKIGMNAEGIFQAAVHEIDQQTSRHDLFPALFTEVSARLYGIKNFRGHQRLIRMDTQTPGFMRAPFEHAATFAFESAVDELAVLSGRDPVELRLLNDTMVDPISGLPFSDRHVAECLRTGAERFGWSARNPQPGSMTAEDGSAIGWGVALGNYPAHVVPVIVRVHADARGGLRVEAGGHEMGQGLRSALMATIADNLGIPASDVTLIVGDTRAVPQHVTAGSWGTASAITPVHNALQQLRERLGLPETGPVDLAAAVTAAGGATVTVESANRGPGQPEAIFDRLRSGLVAISGPQYADHVSFSHSAHFVEVRIEPSIHRIRVHRVVSVIDCGRVVSPVTAESQVRGAVVWGLGGSLREASEVDPRYGGFLNSDMAEYAIPVNLDIRDIDVSFVNKPDTKFSPLGAKGIGEVAMCGVGAAIANAVHHATGRRIRKLPIHLEDVL